MQRIVLFAALLTGAAAFGGEMPAPAPRQARLHFIGTFVLEHQFNPIATLTYSDGSEAIIGDALIGLNAGGAWPLTADGRFELQGLAGYAFSRANATNGSATFHEFPVELTAIANVESVRIGVGPVVHLASMLRGSGFASAVDLDFDTAVGGVVRAEYRLSAQLGLELHGTWLRLSANGRSADASRIGGALTLSL